MSEPTTKSKNNPTHPSTHSEWIQSALTIIQAGREAELQHRQTVAEMKAMAETLAMQAPFPATIMAVSALVRDNGGDVAGKAFVERVLWDVIEELAR